MFHWQKRVLCYFWQKITLATNEECIESSVMPIETKRFFEEETVIEALNNVPTICDDNSEEDLLLGVGLALVLALINTNANRFLFLS